MNVAIELMSQDILDKVGQVSGAPELLKDIISAQGFDSSWEAVGWLASLRSIPAEDIFLKMELKDVGKIFDEHWKDIISLLTREAKKSGNNNMCCRVLDFVCFVGIDGIPNYKSDKIRCFHRELLRDAVKAFSSLVDEIA